MKSDYDFEYRDFGTIKVLIPTSEDGEAWVAAHLPEDCPRWARGYAIESNYIRDILDGILNDGLTVES